MPARANLLFFTTEDCPGCEILKPIAKKVAAKHRTRMDIIEVTDNIELAQEYDVSILPTIAYKDYKIDGMCEEKDIENLFC